jgi:hypothetical protein
LICGILLVANYSLRQGTVSNQTHVHVCIDNIATVIVVLTDGRVQSLEKTLIEVVYMQSLRLRSYYFCVG